MADISGNIKVSGTALESQLDDIASEANLQRITAIGSLANDLNITVNQKVSFEKISLSWLLQKDWLSDQPSLVRSRGQI